MNKRGMILTILSIVMLISSSCAVALLGGAGATGYYVGKDKRTVGVIAEDARITAEINTKYMNDDLVDTVDVDVDTYEGVVTLWGNLPSQAAIDRAVALAQSVKGVHSVISKLKIIPK